jgi:23S rRNA (uracil1939-C5)-methyltransferase
MENKLPIGQKLTIEVQRLGINGEGIGYHNRKAIFVDFALPKEEVEVEITADFDTYYKANLVQIVKKSPSRVEPFCPVYHECGGCQLQHLAYDETLKLKRELIIQAIRRYVKSPVSLDLIKETIGSTPNTHYRNKASLPLQYKYGKNVIGMYKPNSNHLVEIKDCPVQEQDINKFYTLILNQMEKRKMLAYNNTSKTGTVRFIIIRRADATSEMQVTFILYKEDPQVVELGKYLVEKFKEIVSVYSVINDDLKSREFFTKNTHLVAGKEAINEVLNGVTFSLKPDAFFQLNTKQADVLYKKVIELGNFKKTDIVIDAFSGIAPIAQYVAPYVKNVYAIESVQASIQSAKDTIIQNVNKNIDLLKGDVIEVLNRHKNIPVDVIVFDPPRTGLGEKVTEFLLKKKPKKIIYISCNPSTLAKDLDVLTQNYEIKSIEPLDMFPFTAHVESISLLSLKTA